MGDDPAVRGIVCLEPLLLLCQTAPEALFRLTKRDPVHALMTIPGYGATTASTILYETHTGRRFRSAQCYSSYCRVVRAD